MDNYEIVKILNLFENNNLWITPKKVKESTKISSPTKILKYLVTTGKLIENKGKYKYKAYVGYKKV